MGRPRSPVVQRFIALTHGPATGCVEWQGRLDLDGYGTFWLDGKQRRAHRAAWLIFVGDLPDDLVVHHECRNRRCVNPLHLNLLTPTENAAERRCCHCGICDRCRHTDYMRDYYRSDPVRAEANRERVRRYKRTIRAGGR